MLRSQAILSVLVQLLCFAALATAFEFPIQLPFKLQIPWFRAKLSLDDPEPFSGTPRIAIIGAGAGGSSAAFWIAKAKERFGLNVEIDVYERNNYVGGRSTTVYPYGNSSLPPMELGASIFVKPNKNLWRASEEFNLTRKGFKDKDFSLGLWDGENLRFSYSGSWWDTFKMVLRYGYFPPKRTQQLVDYMIKHYLTLYSPDSPKWDNITDLASALGFTELISKSTEDWFKENGVSQRYISELIEAGTRVNYGQNVDKIHALEGACSMAADDAVGIEGGNFQLFQKFLEYSKANVYLNTTVLSISPKSESSHLWTVSSDSGSKDYKGVILAAPFHQTGITLPSELSAYIPEVPYVHLHVTLLTTNSSSINCTYLNLKPADKAPQMLLTTYDGVRGGGKAPEFNSISYHTEILPGEWTVKIFSKARVSDKWLKKLFGHVGWVYRKEWDAYPVLPPTTTFPPVRLDRGLFYVNAFETFISTMETETIASRNVVDLLLNEEFKAGICSPKLSPSTPPTLREAFKIYEKESKTVLGWDC